MDRVLIISEFSRTSGAPTGTLASALAKSLEASGLKAFFLNVPFKYTPGGLRPSRIINMMLLNLAIPIYMIFHKVGALYRRELSCVIVTSSPPMIQWGAGLFGKIVGIPVIYWLQDAHPEIEARMLEKSGWKSAAIFLRFLDRVFSRLLAAVMTLDDAMKKSFLATTRYQGEVLVQPPAATYFKPAKPLRQPNPQCPLRFLYAGNYGATHDLAPFADWLRNAARGLSNYSITFVGMSSAGQAAIRRLFADDLSHIIFLKRLDSLGDLSKLMDQATFGIVALSESSAGVVCPSKAISYLSQGLPLLHIGPKDVLSWALCQNGWGVALDSLKPNSTMAELFLGRWENAGRVFPNPEVLASEAFVALVHQVLRKAQPS